MEVITALVAQFNAFRLSSTHIMMNNTESSSATEWFTETTAVAMATANDSELDGQCGDNSSYPAHQVVMSGLCVPMLIGLGLVANILNVMIFCQPQMRRSLVNWYLAWLSLSDLLNLICAIFIIPLPVLAEVFGSAIIHDVASASVVFAYPTGLTMQTASVYLTVLVSAHRYIGVCHPFQSQRVCTPRTVRTAIGLVGIFALAYNLSRFFELSLLHCHSALYNATVIQVLPSSLRRHPQYVEFYLGWSYTGVMLVVPFLLLIAMNIRVILAVHRTRKRHQYEMCRTDDNSNNGAKEAAKERSTTVMLVGIVVVFLVCNFLALLANILEILMKADERLADAISGPYEQIVSLSNLLVLVNMSVNSLIYLSFSDRYRTLLRYFCSYVRHRGADRWMLDSLPN